VYAAINYKGVLYLGTNQGLFYRSSKGGFIMVDQTEGQVWSLAVIGGELFCGHDRGTFIIDNSGDARKISNIQGTWKVTAIPGQKELLLQGNYNGLYVLEKGKDDWQLRNKIEGFDTSARYFEFISPEELVVSHEYKGLFYLSLDQELRFVEKMRQDDLQKSVNSSLVRFKNEVYYGTESGIYVYNEETLGFEKDSVVSRLAHNGAYVSGKLMLTDNGDKLWYASESGLSYLRSDNLTGDFVVNSLALPLGRRATKSGYEHLLKLTENSYFLGTTEGYIIIDLSQQPPTRDPMVLIDRVFSSVIGGSPVPVKYSIEPQLDNEQNTLEFSFYAPYYDVFLSPEYRYKLKGYYNQWSDWTSNSQVIFENLPYGDYELLVQSRIGDQLSQELAAYKFNINKPWYLGYKAMVAYAVVFLVLSFVVHFLYRSYYKQQRNRLIRAKEKELEFRELENQQQIMSFRNENLQLDIENKNRELGLSTMNLIQKNELLNDIKNQLSKVSSMKEIKEVVRIINKNLNTSADWKLFEEAFNNADKDFLKNVKSKHPNLTANDLRLCAYLRLNLSSKEIAPLLNISHKSVEVKRYRLRKKMELDHETNLTDYILQI
jgi:DNA-binding CsgD family transcriptional regulator